MDNVAGLEMGFESERGLGEDWDSSVQRVLDHTLVHSGVVRRCPDSIAEKSNYLFHKRTHA